MKLKPLTYQEQYEHLRLANKDTHHRLCLLAEADTYHNGDIEGVLNYVAAMAPGEANAMLNQLFEYAKDLGFKGVK